jgi:hypothetical protein
MVRAEVEVEKQKKGILEEESISLVSFPHLDPPRPPQEEGGEGVAEEEAKVLFVSSL